MVACFRPSLSWTCVIELAFTNHDKTLAVKAVCANLCGRCELSSCAFDCLSKQMLIIRANFWRLIDAFH